MNTDAIFSDCSGLYVDPCEPEINGTVTIKIRTFLEDDCKVSLMIPQGNLPMRLYRTEGVFAYHKTTIFLSDKKFVYAFCIEGKEETKYFDRIGVSDEPRLDHLFSITPGFHSPKWMKGAVIYQIMVDRFRNGDRSNDVLTDEYAYNGGHSKHIDDWYQYPANNDVGNFYGGDLEGVRQKFDYLKSLGIDVIYFNPLFVSPSNHKYDIQDYEHIDPHFAVIKDQSGSLLAPDDQDNSHASLFQSRVCSMENLNESNLYFANFVREAHMRGIKVIIDGVFNHCGSFNRWMDREHIYKGRDGFPDGAYVSKDSPYHDFFQFNGGTWPDNDKYDGWWGYGTLPKLNYENSEELVETILKIGAKWVSPPFNADGWRLDVAADLGHSEQYNHEFWRRFRQSVKNANPDAVILAEHYGDASAWLQGDQWDTVMNYDAFMEPVTFFLTGMEKHSDSFDASALGNGERFEDTMRYNMAKFMEPSLYSAMNEISNHDHSRFLTRTNRKVGRVSSLGPKAAEEGVDVSVMRQAVMMMMTWPGAPTIYYGDEAGLCGFTDPDNRRTYPWGRENISLIDFHRDMVMLHNNIEALKTGSFMFLKCTQALVSYARMNNDEICVIAINGSSENRQAMIPVWKAGVPMRAVMTAVIISNEVGYSILPVNTDVISGQLNDLLQPHEACLFKYKVR